MMSTDNPLSNTRTPFDYLFNILEGLDLMQVLKMHLIPPKSIEVHLTFSFAVSLHCTLDDEWVLKHTFQYVSV